MNVSMTSSSGQGPGFLAGGGEMGQRTREFDWASTPVGPVDTWPQSLRTAVSIVLRSRFPMFMWWGKDLIQFYNDAYRPSLGNNGKHPLALGQRGEACWPEIWPVIHPLIKQVLEGGESTWSEDQLIPIYRNGQLEDVYWTFSYSALVDESGSVNGVLVVCNENTERILNHKVLQENENQLSFAIEAAELATWDYNPLTGKFTSNNRLKNWFGLKPSDEIELSAAIEAIVPKDRPRVTAAIERALQYESGGHYDIQYTIANKMTDERRIVRAKGRVWFNEEKVAYRFNGTLQDITEQEMVRLKLEQAEERARLAIESADLGTYEVDLRTDEMITSERFKAIWGISSSESRADIIALIHPDDRDLRIKAHQEALRTGNIDYETRAIRKDLSEHWVKVKGKVMYDGQGKAARMIGVIQDITEQKQFSESLSAQVKERTLELQRSNDDLLQFAHVITHDLKEPVRKVKIFSNRIKEEMQEALPPKATFYLDKIQNATERMYSMIEGVLNYSKLGVAEEEMEAIDLNEIIKSIQTDLEVLVEQKHATIAVEQLPVIQGSAILFYQLFYNLINNSLKFSRKDVNPVITLSADLVNENGKAQVRIMVTDNGIGFEQEYAARIFNTFTRLNSKDAFEGTGLGLSLSKKIVERYGGSISAAGIKEKGATFTIQLPLKHY